MQKNNFFIPFFFLFFLATYVSFFWAPDQAHAAPTLAKKVGTVALYTYDSTCAGAKKQSILFDTTSASFNNTYLYIHGQTAPTPDAYCTGTFGLCARAAERSQSIFVAFAMSGSGAEWVSALDFTCLYNEAKTQISSIGKTMPNSHIIAAYSYGGGALKKIYTNNQQPTNVTKTLLFDACFPGWCEYVAKTPSSKRGTMHIYASNASGNDNGKKNQTGAQKALTVSQDGIQYVYVPTDSHASIPKICFRDHYMNDKCGNKGEEKISTAANAASNASVLSDLGDAYNSTPLTLDEIEELLQTPVPRIKIPGLNFTNPTIKNLQSNTQDGQTYINSPYLGEYISAIYRYTVIFISIFSVFVLIVSGAQWILRGSDSGERDKIKKRIMQAIMGLLLSLGSYLILYLVNPRLVELGNVRVLFINKAPFPVITEESVDTNAPADAQIAVSITEADKVDISFFMQTSINGSNVDGWSLWQGLTEEEKKIILPHLFAQVAPSCPEGHLVQITGIPGWNNKKIHPALLDSFRKVNETAKNIGFQLVPGSVHRPAKTMVPLWNTGIIARYKQGRRDWEINEGKIAKPTCQTGHSMGAAVDANLVHIKSGKRLPATDTSKITKDNYINKFASDPYKVILEQIFHRSGWVRYCSEHWHFEYAVTPRAQAWDGTARCWMYNDTFEQPIPKETIDEVNKIIGFNFMN